MNPVRTEGSNVVYKGTNPEIQDLWCQRIKGGVIRTTWELDDVEKALLAAGGRVVLTIYKEPIPPVRLGVVPNEVSQPIGKHGWKIPVEPGDILDLENKGEGDGTNNGQEGEGEQASQDQDSGSPQREAPEASTS